MRIKERKGSLRSSKCCTSRTHKSRVACVFTAPVRRSTPSESIESRWNRSGSPSRYPYIPTFRGRAGLSFALELPKQPSLRSCRVQDTTRFSYHMNGHLSKVRLRRENRRQIDEFPTRGYEFSEAQGAIDIRRKFSFFSRGSRHLRLISSLFT